MAKCAVTVTEDKQLITNDRFYTDTDGNTLYSQGGGIFKYPDDDKYYWYGVRYKEAVSYAADPLSGKTVEHPAFEAYTLYTSDDLVNWKYEGDVATLETLGQTWCGWAGRCGVVYNEKANKLSSYRSLTERLSQARIIRKDRLKRKRVISGAEPRSPLSQTATRAI